MAIFNDQNLFKKSIEYAMNTPLVKVKSSTSRPMNFKEITDIDMTDVQRKTMQTLVDEDTFVEKLRNPKVDIIFGDEVDENSGSGSGSNPQMKFIEKSNNVTEVAQNELGSNNINVNNNSASGNINEKKNEANKNQEGALITNFVEINNQQNKETKQTISNNNIAPDGPIDLSKFMSFLQVNSKITSTSQQGGGGKGGEGYSKPITVKLKLPAKPDGKIAKLIQDIEKIRNDYTTSIFEKVFYLIFRQKLNLN